jgi:hypothetical protein
MMRGETRRRDFPFRRLLLLSAALVLALTLYLHFLYFPGMSPLPDGGDRQWTVGQVTGKRAEREETGREVYRLTFQFRTVDGRTVRGEAKVGAKRYQAAQVGGEVFVEYSLKEPQRHHLVEPTAANGASSEMAPERPR